MLKTSKRLVASTGAALLAAAGLTVGVNASASAAICHGGAETFKKRTMHETVRKGAGALRLGVSVSAGAVRRWGETLWRRTVKYLLMICGDETAAAHANDGCGGWSEEMEQRGVVEGGAGLRPPSDATTVRVRNDELLLTDGPFAETKEQIGGFVLINCADLDEAIEIAAKHPAAGYGTIEIRPVLDGPPELG